MLLDLPYETVLRAHAIVRPHRTPKAGVWRKDYARIAAFCGKRIVKAPIDFERYPIGILTTRDHAVLYFNGHVVEEGDIWEYDDWIQWLKPHQRDLSYYIRE